MNKKIYMKIIIKFLFVNAIIAYVVKNIKFFLNMILINLN